MTEALERVLAQFQSESGECKGAPMDLPVDIDASKLTLLFNAVFNEDSEKLPYVFFLDDVEIKESLRTALKIQEGPDFGGEKVVKITFAPQAVFRVRPVTRCSATLPGHSEAVVSASFSNDGKKLASGSGDSTVRFWDLTTQTPYFTSKGHRNWVLCICWAPNGLKLASACKNGEIIIWDPKTGNQIGATLRGHRDFIYALAWEPYHR